MTAQGPAEHFSHKRVRLAGRSRDLYAPHDDPFLAHFGRGARYRDFARFAHAALRPGDRVLDVGANIGVTSLILSDAVGPTGRVVAVEASPDNARALRRTLEANGAANTAVENCAVGAENREVAFHQASAYGFVREDANLLGDHLTVPVPMRTLDAVVETTRLDRVNLVKLDIEGYEWEALRGAGETLDRHDPLIFLEFNSWCQIAFFDRNPRSFLGFLLDTFAELHVWENGGLLSVRRLGAVEFLRRHLIETSCISDLVACRSPDRIAALSENIRVPLARRVGLDRALNLRRSAPGGGLARN